MELSLKPAWSYRVRLAAACNTVLRGPQDGGRLASFAAALLAGLPPLTGRRGQASAWRLERGARAARSFSVAAPPAISGTLPGQVTDRHRVPTGVLTWPPSPSLHFLPVLTSIARWRRPREDVPGCSTRLPHAWTRWLSGTTTARSRASTPRAGSPRRYRGAPRR